MQKYPVLEMTKNHLKEKIDPASGIIIGPRPKQLRMDVVTLGLLARIEVEESELGMININIYHEDTERIEELTVSIIEVMDHALVENYLFTFDKQYNFRMSRTLHMSNVRVGYEKPLL